MKAGEPIVLPSSNFSYQLSVISYRFALEAMLVGLIYQHEAVY
ncbi:MULTISPECIES: hypothetical protein [Fischerella]|nr:MULTISPECIES: hypothetical protein [Fischerella]